MNIKRIIAREGLVIIGCVMVAILCGYLSGIFPYTSTYDYPTKYSYKVSAGDKTWIYTSKESTPYIDLNTRWEFFQVARRDYPKEFEQYGTINNAGFIPKEFIVEYVGQIEKVLTEKEKRNNSLNRFFNDLFMFSIFGLYPLYLLIRFIIWAVRTLKGK